MKKLIMLVLALGLLQISAYAQVDSLTAECGTEGKTAVTGRVPASEEAAPVGIRVLKPGKNLSELGDDPTANLAITDFMDQWSVPAGETGFTYSFVLPEGETGYRQARLTDTEGAEELTLSYVTQEDYAAAAAAANAALTSFDAFKAACQTGNYMLCLGFDESIASGLSADAALQILYESVKAGGLDLSDRVETVRLWRAASLAALCNRGGANLADYPGCLNYFSDTVKAWADFVDQNGKGTARLAELLANKNFRNLQEFEDGLKESLILTVTQYHNGVDNIGKVLKDFSDVTGVTADNETGVYQQLAGRYDSLTAVLNKYKEIKEGNPGGASPGGSSPGGGSTGRGPAGPGGVPGGSLVTDNNTGAIKPAQPIQVRFNDLDAVDWAYEAVMTLADRGIINGRSENTFEPMASVTREEFVKLLVCALGYGDNSYTTGHFADVVPGEWYEKYVYIAANTGLVNGVSEQQFGVGTDITRQDMAVLIYRALAAKGTAPESSEPGFDDAAQIADYAKGPVGALSGGGLINGVGENRFEPNGTATRAEAAQILFNVLSRIS